MNVRVYKELHELYKVGYIYYGHTFDGKGVYGFKYAHIGGYFSPVTSYKDLDPNLRRARRIRREQMLLQVQKRRDSWGYFFKKLFSGELHKIKNYE